MGVEVHVQSGDSADHTFVQDVNPSAGQTPSGAKHPSSPAMTPSGAVSTLHTSGDGHGVPEDQVEGPPRISSFTQVCSALLLQRFRPGVEQSSVPDGSLHAFRTSTAASAMTV